MFDIKKKIRDIACSNAYLYICIENKEDGVVNLLRYDCENDNLVVAEDNIQENSAYEDDDIHLFFATYNFGVYKRFIGKYLEKTRLIGSYDTFFTDRIKLDLTSENICIKCNEINYEFRNEYSFTDLYKKVYLIDNQLLFATYRNVNNSFCASDDSWHCICGLRESYLYKFDLLTNTLSLIKQFDSGTFLVDYDLENVQYYYNGGLYINDNLHRNCEILKPIENDSHHRSSDIADYNISYYHGEFYGI